MQTFKNTLVYVNIEQGVNGQYCIKDFTSDVMVCLYISDESSLKNWPPDKCTISYAA